MSARTAPSLPVRLAVTTGQPLPSGPLNAVSMWTPVYFAVPPSRRPVPALAFHDRLVADAAVGTGVAGRDERPDVRLDRSRRGGRQAFGRRLERIGLGPDLRPAEQVGAADLEGLHRRRHGARPACRASRPALPFTRRRDRVGLDARRRADVDRAPAERRPPSAPHGIETLPASKAALRVATRHPDARFGDSGDERDRDGGRGRLGRRRGGRLRGSRARRAGRRGGLGH